MDELRAMLERKSFDELGIMATNPDSVWSLDNFAEIKMLRVEIQSCKAAVQRLAKANLARRPDIEQLMQESRHSRDLIEQARPEYDELVRQKNDRQSQYAPGIVRKKMREATRKAEQAAMDLESTFEVGQEAAFCDKFLQAKILHRKREKMQEKFDELMHEAA